MKANLQIKFCCQSCAGTLWEVSIVEVSKGERKLILDCPTCQGFTFLESLFELPPGAELVNKPKTEPS